jgi:hypothetical protein
MARVCGHTHINIEGEDEDAPPVMNFSWTVMPAAAILARRPLLSSLLR